MFLTGDFNAYSEEDPVQVLDERRLQPDLESTSTPGEETYSFDGTVGLARPRVRQRGGAGDGDRCRHLGHQRQRVQRVPSTHITTGNVTQLSIGTQPFAASDHDPELVGINVPDAANVQVTASPATLKVKKDEHPGCR